MNSGRVYVDFEFNKTAEPVLNLVCASTIVEEDGVKTKNSWWLHKCEFSKDMLKYYLLQHQEKTFFAYSVEAEARSMLALDLDPVGFKWIDLFLEYRMLQNHNHDLLHGLQLIDGKIKRTYPYGEKGKQSLAAALYKLVGKQIDTEHKTKMRDLIISAPEEFNEDDKISIMAYCDSDTAYLPELLSSISKYYPKVIPKTLIKTVRDEALLRGDFAARTAKMVALGYPVNLEWLHNFSGNAPAVMETCIRDINAQFPEEEQPFRWNRSAKRFSLHEKVVKDWIKKKHGTDWEKTKTGDISLALESFTKKYHYSHDYPEGHMAAQMIRYLKLKQAMNGYNPNAEKTIFDALGSDGRIRAHLNPYGAQSSRSQAKSTAFIFLKPAWQRSMVQPRQGRAIAGLDFSSEEFLLSALCSKDKKMLEAYRSGDVYLAFGKMIGWIPQDGTKKSHKFERDCCKALVLGLSYLMSKYGLAHKLTEDTGKLFTEDEAQELIDQFDETFSDFAEWRKELIATYGDEGHIKLPCGWYLFGDNDNFRSVGNVPIQGLGACILRKAVSFAQDAGLDVIFPLHDALYIEYDSFDYKAIDTLKDCMDRAFQFYFEGDMREASKMIRIEGETWGPNYEKAKILTPGGFEVEQETIHVDPRAEKEWAIFSRYMVESLGEELL